MVDLMYYRGPKNKNKSWVQDCTQGVMVDPMYYHGPTKQNKSWVQDCTRGVMVDLMTIVDQQRKINLGSRIVHKVSW